MAVSIVAVRVLNNPAAFTDVLAFEIEYEALENLQEDLTWKLVYVGSADSDQYDQVLENVEVGPVVAGTFKFVLEANPPNPEAIPTDDLVGVTVILLTCSYRGKEFIRVGYYVGNEYIDEELRENPPEVPRVDRLQRSILADQPRVTRYAIPFDEPSMPEGVAPMDEDAPQVQPSLAEQACGAELTPTGAGVPGAGQPMPMQGQGMAFSAQQPPPQQMFQYVPVQ